MFKLLRFFTLVGVATALLLGGCASWRPATEPIDTRIDRASCSTQADTLLVFLPGAGSDPEEFVREGFVRALRERGIAADVMLVDAHMGYYNNRSIARRLEADVFVPARARGYSTIWLVGISVGGFGALIHEELLPGSVAGLVVLAPYLGKRDLSNEIHWAGGLRAWPAPDGPLPLEEMETRLWRWLQAYGAAPLPDGRPPLYLGYGLGDRFAFSHRLLAAALPPERVFTTPGGHDWPQWRRLWQQALDVLPLPVCRNSSAVVPPR